MVDMECLDSSAIALIIRWFNIVSVAVLAGFAVYGGVAIARRKRPAGFLTAFCAAAILAFAAEAVFFNYAHYLKLFAGEEFSITGISSQNAELSDSSVVPKALVYYGENKKVTESSVTLTNLNRKVTSVFIRPKFDSREQLDVRMRWTDESDVGVGVMGFKKTLYKALPHENHIAVHTCGKVSELEIIFPEQTLFDGVDEIAVNRRIPYYFSGLRLLAVSLAFFAAILFAYKPLRAKAAYYLLEYKFDPADRRQTAAYAGLVALTLLFSWFCDYTTTGTKEGHNTPIGLRYNGYLVDALIAGRTNIDHGNPEALLGAQRPHNKWWLRLNGYEGKVEFTGDISYYKGKFYIYYGVVPAALVYLPYKLLTGRYLSHHAGMFAFTAAVLVFMSLLWRLSVARYMPNARFAFAALGYLALFFAGHFFSNVRAPGVHCMVSMAGLAFLMAGAYLLLKSVGKEAVNLLFLFFACLCFALSVGCRPNMALASVLVPAVLWKRRSWGLAAFVLIPYAMVAAPLCAYNYARFGSVFEFGYKYLIGQFDGTAVTINPIGQLHRALVILVLYLFRLYSYSPHFPFVDLVPPPGLTTYFFGFQIYYNQGGGLINFPIVFCLFYLFKSLFRGDRRGGLRLSAALFAVGAAMVCVYAKIGIFHGRYLVDCAAFFILPSLFCAYYWCDGGGSAAAEGVSRGAFRLKVVYALLAVSIFVGLCLFAVGPDQYVNAHLRDPALYRYLESSLGLVERF